MCGLHCMIAENRAKDEYPDAKELLKALNTDVLFTEEPSRFLRVKSTCYECCFANRTVSLSYQVYRYGLHLLCDMEVVGEPLLSGRFRQHSDSTTSCCTSVIMVQENWKHLQFSTGLTMADPAITSFLEPTYVVFCGLKGYNDPSEMIGFSNKAYTCVCDPESAA